MSLPPRLALGALALAAVGAASGAPPPGGGGLRGPLADVRAVGSFDLVPCTEAAAQNDVSFVEEYGYLKIRGNGLPDHAAGAFPNGGNPNQIAAQDHEYKVPLQPAGGGGELHGGRVGVALNGVPLDPGTAEHYNNDRSSGWRYEALSGAIDLGLDCNHAHVQPTGTYHYHGVPEGLLDVDPAAPTMQHVGYAADGYPLYARYGHADADDASSPVRPMTPSYRLRSGQRDGGPGGAFDGTFVQDWEYVEGLGDLDACNGRVGETPEHGRTYHYLLTDAFPFVPRCTVADADDSFAIGPEPGGRGGHPPHRGR